MSTITSSEQVQIFQLITLNSFVNTKRDDTMKLKCSILNVWSDEDNTNCNQLKISFSNINKHPKLQISQCGQVVKDNSFCSKKFIACDSVIPTEGIHQFTFSINQGGTVYIGICILDQINIDNLYFDIWSKIDHGTYLLCNDGFVFSHHQQDVNRTETHVKFQQNDKIIVQVNQKEQIITWQKLGTNDIISMQIKNDKDLYPCLIIESSEISII